MLVPLPTKGGQDSLEIWVPTLGAYVVNKASTFAARQEYAGGGNPKRAKDLLYLRDLMAAGTEVMSRIESDLAEIAREKDKPRPALRIGYARNTLRLSLTGTMRRVLPDVSRMLVEREPRFTEEAALADIAGRLADLVEILSEHVD